MAYRAPRYSYVHAARDAVLASGSITAFADGGGGMVQAASTAHGLGNGRKVTISGTTNYDGTYLTSSITANTFEFEPDSGWVATDVGAWEAVNPFALEIGTADADFPVDNLADDRVGTQLKWSAALNDPAVIVDLGVSGITGLNRLIIPANHNLELVRIAEADNPGFSGATLLSGTIGVTPGTLIDIPFTASQERYIRAKFWNTGPTQHYLSQLYFTKIVTLDVGPVLSDAVDALRANVTRLIQKTGLSPTVQDGPDQRLLEYPYEFALSSTDLTAMEAFIASVGMYRPFFVDPHSFSTPPETDEPALWMKFEDMPESRIAVDVPMSGTRSKTYRLRLIESLD